MRSWVFAESIRALVNALAARLVLPGSPFELAPHGTGVGSIRVFRHAPPSLNAVYSRVCASASRPYMVFGGRTISFGDLLGRSNSLARELSEQYGSLGGQRVGLVLASGPQWLAAFVAVTSIGAVAALIESSAPVEQIISALNAANCIAVIADEDTARLLADCGARHRVLIARNARYDPQMQAACFDTPIDPDQPALITFTSGSTGQPKGVVSTHRAVITGMMNMMLGSALAARREKSRQSATQPQLSPSSLLLAPFTHIGGYSHLLLMMWVAGKVAVLPSWHLGQALELIRQEEIRTISGASPDRLTALVRADPERHDLGSVSAIGVHGTALRPALLREMQERLPAAVLRAGYGMTETNGSICVAATSEIVAQSCGPFVPSVEARIVDENGDDVPTGATGEIWVRGAMLMSGYCPAQRDSRVLQSGWYRTEDWGRLDTDGNLFLAERRQDLVYLRGKPISYARLERLACDCSALDDAAAVVVGEGERSRLVLAVVPRDAEAGNEARIAERLSREDALSGCKVDILEVESLPRTRSGKIDRHALRRRLNT